MSCKKYSNLLNDLVEGELDDQTSEQVELHIFSCPMCEAGFEILNREKEIYSHFLFDVKPPEDLSQGFQAKLESVEQKKNLLPIALFNFNNWRTDFFGLLSFKPLLAGAIVLIFFGFGYFLLNNLIKTSDKTIVLQPQTPTTFLSVNPENKESEEQSKAKPSEIAQIETQLPKNIKKVIETKSKTDADNKNSIKKPMIRENKSPDKIENPNLNNEEAKIKEIQAFEIETAKQIEKVELLLRSFRNARFVEDGEAYDIAYERQQARKLLNENVRLRRQAEIYGATFTNEVLGRIEPYLLEIANLDINASVEEVLEIKQRVKNQNIIVSLQSFASVNY